MKIAIVCNGWKCRLKENGAFIDSCDYVVRMNRFHLEGFEKYVGSKTSAVSLMITGEGSTSGILGYDPLLKYVAEAKHIWIPDKYRAEHQHQRNRASDHYRKSLDDFLFVDGIVYDRLYHKMSVLCEGKGIAREWFYPDSGMTNIETALYRFPSAEIYVFGFDPHRRHPYKYYWDDSADGFAENEHPQIAESIVFDDYLEKGIVHER